MDSTDKILARDFSEEFIQLMKNRILTSHYKYGWICDTYPELADAVACLDQRLALYRESGNTEHLVDVANFAMIEFMRPRHPQAHFKGTDSDQSPGLVGTSYKQLIEGIEHEAWKSIPGGYADLVHYGGGLGGSDGKSDSRGTGYNRAANQRISVPYQKENRICGSISKEAAK